MEEKDSKTPIVDKSLEILDQLKKEPLNVEKQIELLRMWINPEIGLYNPETHVLLPKVKWRRFSEELPEVGRGIYVSKPKVMPTFIKFRMPEDLSVLQNLYWTYADSVDLSQWLPK